MAEHNGKRYNPDFICQNDWEWLTNASSYTTRKSESTTL